MSKRKIYFNHFYRIWKVGKTQKKKVAFWEKNFVSEFTIGEWNSSAKERLNAYEFLHLFNMQLVDQNEVEIPDAKWPNPYQIYIEKFYWERGVSESPSARLRYFRTHFTEHFKRNRTDNLSDEKILADCELFLIIAQNHVEIDPKVKFA